MTGSEALRDHFLGWQCRVRQYAVRHAGGRPTSGMRPHITVAGEAGPLARITVLIVKDEPQASTARFRFLVQKTQDPAERYEGALRFLAAAYFQKPKEFSDEMTALFGPGSEIARRALDAGRCVLEFEQYQQSYCVPCEPRLLDEDDPAYQATYWHNRLFNASLPGDIAILAFRPDWAAAQAHPPAG